MVTGEIPPMRKTSGWGVACQHQKWSNYLWYPNASYMCQFRIQWANAKIFAPWRRAVSLYLNVKQLIYFIVRTKSENTLWNHPMDWPVFAMRSRRHVRDMRPYTKRIAHDSQSSAPDRTINYQLKVPVIWGKWSQVLTIPLWLNKCVEKTSQINVVHSNPE